jgi:hypothetical protein
MQRQAGKCTYRLLETSWLAPSGHSRPIEKWPNVIGDHVDNAFRGVETFWDMNK